MNLRYLASRLYWRIAKPRTIGVRAVVTTGMANVLLVKHNYSKFWHLPGGGVEKGETIAGALTRELMEEVGLNDVRVSGVVGIYNNSSEGKDDHVIIFRVDTTQERLEMAHAHDPREISQAAVFLIDELPDDISPATRRRIFDARDGGFHLGGW